MKNTLDSLSAEAATFKNPQDSPRIARIWHGWTTRHNAIRLERLLKQEVFPDIEKNKTQGYLGIQLLKRFVGDEVEFTTIMLFDSPEAVKGFAGEDFEKAHIDTRVKSFFLRYDVKAEHSQVLYSNYW